MRFRRSVATSEKALVWRQFLERHHDLAAAAQLPGWIIDTRDRWDDFLMHGHLDHHSDAADFSIDSLSGGQYEALRALADRYFIETDADYTPMAFAGRERDLSGLTIVEAGERSADCEHFALARF